jgi:hypothetical protein
MGTTTVFGRGFAHDELDFIINYDVKYRMGTLDTDAMVRWHPTVYDSVAVRNRFFTIGYEGRFLDELLHAIRSHDVRTSVVPGQRE